ncbi:MAG: hypothetical protein ACTSW1_01960, partial [Candidatus Hodarchaeales archaeon]
MKYKVLFFLGLFIVVLISQSASDSVGTTYCLNTKTLPENRSINALYLYSNYTTGYYNEYKALFNSVDAINLEIMNITEFMKNNTIAKFYNIVIVGASAFDYWTNPNASRSNAIVDTERPVLALSSGGGTFFQGLGIGYGGGAMSFTTDGIYVNANDASHAIFSQTYSFNVPGNIIFRSTHTMGLYMGNNFSDTEFLATDHDKFVNHSILAEYTGFTQKMIYLGIYQSPPDTDDNLFKLIYNIIEYLAGTPTDLSVSIISPSNQSETSGSEFQVTFSFTGEKYVIYSELLVNCEEYVAGPLTKTLAGFSGTDTYVFDMTHINYYSDDWYKITVVILDNVGWTASSSILVLRNEYPDPILTINSPDNNSVFTTGVNISFNLSVEASYLDLLTYKVDGIYTGTIADPDAGFNGTFNINLDTNSLES